jgi:DeoR family fructose operon transcriptional repressor
LPGHAHSLEAGIRIRQPPQPIWHLEFTASGGRICEFDALDGTSGGLDTDRMNGQISTTSGERVLAAKRHDLIGAALRSTGVVSTEDLARQLGVSPETIRRDLVVLERGGALRRVHGGAALGQPFGAEEPSFADRQTSGTEQKRAIGRRAAQLVSSGQTIVLDVGTTALEVARALPVDFRGAVATCSLLVAAELADRRGIDVLVSGGRLRGGDLALANAQTVSFFADLRSDLAFLGSGGVDAIAGLTDFHLDEVATRRTIIANAARCYVLADAGKLGRIAPHRVCGLGDVDGLVTEGAVPRALGIAIQGGGGAILTA